MERTVKAVTIDNGGSELRILPNGKGEKDIIHVSGGFYEIPDEEFRDKEVSDPCMIQNVLRAPDTMYVGYIGAGTSAKMYKGKMLQMDSTRRKTQSEEFYRQIVFGVALSIIKDEEFYGIETATSLDAYEDQLSKNIEVVLCTNIPVKEHSGRQEFVAEFKDQIAGEYTVEFPLLPAKPEIKFTLKEKHIGVLPEGGVVVSAVGSKLGDDDYSLVIDLGHVSNDLSIYRGKTLYGSTVISSSRAGSTLLGLIQSALIDQDMMANEEIAVIAVTHGIVMDGRNETVVCDLVREAKEEFVTNFVKPDIIQLLNTVGIKPSQVRNIIPVGFLMNDDVDLGSMTEMIMTEVGMTKADVIKATADLRYANLMSIDKFTTVVMKNACKQMMSE